MEPIDYSRYTIDDLLSAKSSIDAEANPGNYQALIAEIEARSDEIQQREEASEAASFALAEKRVKIIGWLQILAALLIALYVVLGSGADVPNSTLTALVAIPLILLNGFAGYTAIKEYTQWYWISVVNQAMQVPSVALNSVMANYSGIGGVYLVVSWGQDPDIGASAHFSPGIAFSLPGGSLPTQSIAFDVLAIVFIVALVTVAKAEKGLRTDGMPELQSTEDSAS